MFVWRTKRRCSDRSEALVRLSCPTSMRLIYGKESPAAGEL
jgi:hypothetical protein